ncbi:MAG TPA: AMP-binding protein [Chloroflexota bacterium]
MTRPQSFGSRLAELARQQPDHPAIIFAPRDGGERALRRIELDMQSNRVAHLLAERGIGAGDMVVVALPNSPEHFVVTLALWKLGACVLPLSPALPDLAREQILATADARAAVADWQPCSVPVTGSAMLAGAAAYSAAPLPDCIPQPGKAIASGGSTGRSKVIVDPQPWAGVPGQFAAAYHPTCGMQPGQVQLVAAPLYHNVPFLRSQLGLFEQHTIVLMERFDAVRAVELIERHRVNMSFLVPTMMSRMLRVPDIDQRDFTSVTAFAHSAAPCPAWLKRRWLDRIGPEHLYETYGASEMEGMTWIRGDEWLQHPGSVGRPRGFDLRIVADDGSECAPGEIGQIYMRDPMHAGPPFIYLGGPPPPATADGFVSAGDLGWVDASGYLYLADRRVDLIISGGANIYAAEVEGALLQHPGVDDVAVIGLPDEDLGKRVHAIIQPVDPTDALDLTELAAFAGERLARYKVPRSFELVPVLPRNEAGKIQRSALVLERSQPPDAPA